MTGFALLVVAGATGAVLDVEGALSMAAMLFMLGIGWNFGVVGGSTLLYASVPVALRPRAEGFGEVSMGLAAGAGAPVSGLVVAFGGFTVLSLAVAAVAMFALVFVYRVA